MNEDEKDVQKTEVDTQSTATDSNVENKNGDMQQEKGQKESSDKETKKLFTQDEVDAIVAREKKKAAQKSIKNEGKVTKEEEQETDKTQDNADDSKEDTKQSDEKFSRYVNAEIKAALAIEGIDSTRIARASRLVDQSKVIVNDEIDESKLKEEIAAVIAEFPELKKSSSETDNKNLGFKFGSDGEKINTSENGMFSSIFGNKK